MESPTKSGSLDSPEQARTRFVLPSRPATPQSPKKSLRGRGSLRSLTSKLSLSSLSLRSKKSSPERKEVTRLNEHVTENSSLDTLQGRRRLSYKPLSIVTTALNPFDFDVTRAMETVQKQGVPVVPADKVNSRSPKHVVDGTGTGTMPAELDNTEVPVKAGRLTNSDRSDDEKTIKPARLTHSEQSDDEKTSNSGTVQPLTMGFFSKGERGESRKENKKVAQGSFQSLTELPPPDMTQHPIYSENPMASTSDAPLMVTTSTAEEIRAWAQEKNKAEPGRADRARVDPATAIASRNAFAATMENPFNARLNAYHAANPDGRRFDGAHGLEAAGILNALAQRHNISRLQLNSDHATTNMSRLQLNPDHATTNIYDVRPDGSPKPPLKTSVDPVKPAAVTPVSEFGSKKTGLHKVAELFKSKPEITEPRAADGGPLRSFQRPDLERHLRITLNCHTFDYSPEQGLPRHPNTSRGWKSRNLHCTTCLDHCCAVCGRACCAFRSAYLGTQNHKDNPEGLLRAQDVLADIANLYPYGKEAPTFLQCTHGAPGDKVGCGKMVCPDCCGVCPNPICADTQCRKCKKNPWTDCVWHDEDMNRVAL